MKTTPLLRPASNLVNDKLWELEGSVGDEKPPISS